MSSEAEKLALLANGGERTVMGLIEQVQEIIDGEPPEYTPEEIEDFTRKSREL